MPTNSLLTVSLITLALSSFGCAAAQSSAALATPASAVVQSSWEDTAAASEIILDQAAGSSAAPASPTPAELPALAVEELSTDDATGIPVGSVRTIFGGEGQQEEMVPVREPRLQTGHALRAPLVSGAGGGIAPDTIRRVVHHGVGQMQMCYARGLLRDAGLAGHVNVTFTIGLNGTVLLARATKDSALPDADVVSCIERSFYLLSFPRPEGSAVQVTYPLVLGRGS
jgi:hypothetical protein